MGHRVSVEEKLTFTGKKASTFFPLTENSSVPELHERGRGQGGERKIA